MKILYIEDNLRLASLVKKNLKQDHFIADTVHTLEDANHSLDQYNYDAVVLDLNLPDGNGIDFLRSVRNKNNNIPILILTANIDFDYKIKGLDLGADDYLIKPFQHQELVARLRAILRRPRSLQSNKITIENIEFDTKTFEVYVAKKKVDMGKRECQVLELLLNKFNKVVTKEELEDKNYSMDQELSSNSIEVSLHRLRKSLSDVKAKVQIKNIRGIGYSIVKL